MKSTLEEKLGHFLVQTALLIFNTGQKASQSVIKRHLNERDDAPNLSGLTTILAHLVRGRGRPGQARNRPQTGEPWLKEDGKEFSFIHQDKVLRDYRACAGLLHALAITSYTGGYNEFSIKELEKYMSENFKVDGDLFQLMLEDFRACKYTGQSTNPLTELIYPKVAGNDDEMIYLKVAAQNPTLLNDYSERLRNRERIRKN